MPLQNGLSVLRELSAEPWLRDVTVVVITGLNPDFDAATLERLSVRAVFTKPTSFDDLIGVVQRIAAICFTDEDTPPGSP